MKQNVLERSLEPGEPYYNVGGLYHAIEDGAIAAGTIETGAPVPGEHDEVEQRVFGEQLVERINELESQGELPVRGWEILKFHFGIGVEKEMTLEEIAESFGIRPERVRQIESSTLKRLRLMLNTGEDRGEWGGRALR